MQKNAQANAMFCAALSAVLFAPQALLRRLCAGQGCVPEARHALEVRRADLLGKPDVSYTIGDP